MQTATSLAIVLLCVGVAAMAEDKPDMQQVLTYARQLARNGQYKEALEKHIWFHENALKHEPAGMVGVRLSFALRYWMELAGKYPEAETALVAIRDKNLKTLTTGEGTAQLFQDVAGINWALDENSKTVDLFQQLNEKQPDLAKKCYQSAQRDLVAAREYLICSKYVPDAVQAFDPIRRIHELDLKYTQNRPDDIQKLHEQMFVDNSCQLIEILAGADRKADVDKVKEKLLAVRDDAEVRDAIEKAITRAKK